MGRPLPAELHALYGLTNGPGPLGGNLSDLRLSDDDEGLVGMGARLRGWGWPIPEELLVLGGNGAEGTSASGIPPAPAVTRCCRSSWWERSTFGPLRPRDTELTIVRADTMTDDVGPSRGVVGVLVRRRRLSIAAVLVLTAALAACVDKGPPAMEEQLRDLGLPLDSVMSVDEETDVMVRLNDERPELMIFTPHRFGGSDLKPWTADRPTVNGGEVGDALSPGIFDDAKRGNGPGWDYLFGAGQGPITDVVVDDPQARAKIVNPEIGGWVIVVPETVEVGSLRWKLIGADDRTLFEATGPGLPADNLMVVDDHARVAVQVRDGEPQLLIFTRNQFGGFDMETRRADRATVGGGRFGVGSSLGPDGKSMSGHRYLFGAGQGPIQGLAVNPEARTSIVNPAVDGWVVVVPKGVPFDALEWQLLGPEGRVIFDATGIDPSPE